MIEGVKPEIVRPLENGQTLYSNNTVDVSPQRGITVLRIMISPNERFSARSSYSGTFTQFETSTPELSTIKVGSSKLADGKTYYVRAQVSYIGAEGGTVTSEWSDVKTFVYSSEQGGVSSITGAKTPLCRWHSYDGNAGCFSCCLRYFGCIGRKLYI